MRLLSHFGPAAAFEMESKPLLPLNFNFTPEL